MLKKLCIHLSGAIVGVITGFIIGPFAAVGKWFSIVREEAIGHEQRDKNGKRKISHGPSPAGIIPGIPFAFIAGFIYGPLRCGYLGAREGIHKNIFSSIVQEMFTYDPFYTDITDYNEIIQIQPEERCLLSYRSLYQTGVINNFQNNSANPVQEKQPLTKSASIRIEKKYGSVDKPEVSYDRSNNSLTK